MMVRKDLLQQIWGGDLTEAAQSETTPLTGILSSLTKLPVVTLTSAHEAAQPFAMMEDTDILEGVSLGDVLSEELGIDVPFGAIVLVQPQSFEHGFDGSAQKLGEILGAILLEMSQGSLDQDLKVDVSLAQKTNVAFSGTSSFPSLSASRLQ